MRGIFYYSDIKTYCCFSWVEVFISISLLSFNLDNFISEPIFSNPINCGLFISNYYNKLLTFELKWADTSILCVFDRDIFPPRMDSILWIASWKPISSVRSASSKTKALMLSSLKLLVCSKWYKTRPGVQNRILVPFLSLDFSWLVSSPP